jgi:hypothetical protein
MTLSDIEAVRLKSSDKSTITREVGRGNNEDVYFKLGHQSVLASPDIEVRVNNVTVFNYTTDYANGVVTFTAPPVQGADIEFVYYWSIFTDAEIQYFIEASGGNVTVATAQLLLAMAADAAKVALRQSQAGGGGLGAVTIDTSVTSRELRASAQALLETEVLIGNTIPAEGLTEPAWTEFSFKNLIEQDLIRNN